MAAPPPAAALARPTVILRHELPDGSSHVDWLLAQDPRGADPLISFRAVLRPDQLAVGASLTALRIADHRAVYLTYEGPVPAPGRDGRRAGSSHACGVVSRLNEGRVERWTDDPDGWTVEIEWTRSSWRQRLRAEPAGGDRWHVTACERRPTSE